MANPFGAPAAPAPMPRISNGNTNKKKKKNNNNRNANTNNNGGNKKKRRNNNNGGGNAGLGAGGGAGKNDPYGTQYANPDVNGFAAYLVHKFYNSSPDIQGLDLQNDGLGPMRYSVF